MEREGHVEQMKKEIIDHYKSGSDNAGKVEKLDDIALLNQLVKDYLNWIGYKYTDIIFAAGIGVLTLELENILLTSITVLLRIIFGANFCRSTMFIGRFRSRGKLQNEEFASALLSRRNFEGYGY